MNVRYGILFVSLAYLVIIGCTKGAANYENVYQEAKILAVDQKYGEAIAYLEKQIPEKNQDTRFYFALGNLYLLWNAEFFTELAVENFLKAHELQPENFPILRFLGTSYSYLEQSSEAVNYLEMAVKQYDPAIHQESEPYGPLALAYYDLGRYDEALKAIDQSLQINPNRGWERLLRGFIFSQLGDIDLLIEEFNTAYQLEPNNIFIPQDYGFRLIEMQELEKAREHYERFLTIDDEEGHSWVRAGLGITELLESNPDEAKKQLDLANQFDIIATEAVQYLSFWHYTQGNDREALAEHVRYRRATAVNEAFKTNPSIEDFEKYYEDNQLFRLLGSIYKP